MGGWLTYRVPVGARIRRLRLAAHIGAGALANRIGVSRTYLYLIESGQRTMRLSIALALSEALDVPMSSLFAEEEDPA